MEVSLQSTVTLSTNQTKYIKFITKRVKEALWLKARKELSIVHKCVTILWGIQCIIHLTYH